MRIALLQNPESGSGDAPQVARLLREHGADVQVFGPADVRDAAASRPERVAVAGGDGSLGCGAQAAALAEAPLAVIPIGTANDFGRAMELPVDLALACRLAVRGTRTRRLDLARMGERPFVNVASVGLAPAAARRARGLKRALGPAAYVIGAVAAGLRAQPVACRLTCDGREEFGGRAWQVTIACSGAFGAGAGVEADPQDGLLDAFVIEAGSRAALAVRAYGLRRGTIGSQRGVRSWRARAIELEVPRACAFNVDGEVVQSGPVGFSVQPRVFELVVG